MHRLSADHALPRRPHPRAAFSLIELTIVLIIMGIMAAITIPRLANSIARRQVELAADRVADDLNLARQQAKALSKSVTVVFNQSAGTCTLVGIPSLDRDGSQYTTRLADPPYRVTVQTVDFGSDTMVKFNGFGEPDTGGILTVTVGRFSRSVTLDPISGRAREGS